MDRRRRARRCPMKSSPVARRSSNRRRRCLDHVGDLAVRAPRPKDLAELGALVGTAPIVISGIMLCPIRTVVLGPRRDVPSEVTIEQRLTIGGRADEGAELGQDPWAGGAVRRDRRRGRGHRRRLSRAARATGRAFHRHRRARRRRSIQGAALCDSLRQAASSKIARARARRPPVPEAVAVVLPRRGSWPTRATRLRQRRPASLGQRSQIAELAPYLDGSRSVGPWCSDLPRRPRHSQARLLRERYQFRGELRATGPSLARPLLFLQRAGFDAFEVTKDADAAASPSCAPLQRVLSADRDGRASTLTARPRPRRIAGRSKFPARIRRLTPRSLLPCRVDGKGAPPYAAAVKHREAGVRMASTSRLQLIWVSAAVIAGLLSAAACAHAQGQRGVHGIIEPKSDAGFKVMAVRGGSRPRGAQARAALFPERRHCVARVCWRAARELRGRGGDPIIAAARTPDVKIIGCHWQTVVHSVFARPPSSRDRRISRARPCYIGAQCDARHDRKAYLAQNKLPAAR